MGSSYFPGVSRPFEGELTEVKCSDLRDAAGIIERQRTLIGELQSKHAKAGKTAAALAQAVKLAQDGLIDVSDVGEHAHRLLKEGAVKQSSVDELFGETPGELSGEATVIDSNGQQMDPLTRVLRTGEL